MNWVQEENFSFLGQITKHCSQRSALTFNKPYEFKGVTFYPIPLGRIVEFYDCLEVLTIKQERTKDKTLMKLPYLWFLVYASENSGKYGKLEYGMFVPLLYALLELVTKSTDIDVKVIRKEDGRYKKCSLYINEIEFSANDFTEIRQLIFRQNGIEHDDSFVNEDAERAVIEGKLFDMKKSGFIPPTLDDLINKFCIYMKKSKREVQEHFSIRDFNLFLTEISTFEDYKILQSGAMSGMVTFEKPIPHWFSGHKPKNMFEGENQDIKNSALMKI